MPIKDEVGIYDQLYNSYYLYSKYTVNNRILCGIYDGLKPVYRRVMLTAYENWNGGRFMKTSSLIGKTMSDYHPHGDKSLSPVIDNMVKMDILEGQGAFSDVLLTGVTIEAAAPRYTEVRLNPRYKDLMDKTLKYVPVIDGEVNREPEFIPTPIPIMAIRGTFGLSYGLSVSIPAFSIKSMLDAYLNDDCMKLESSFGTQIVNKEILNQVWNYGTGTIKYKFNVSWTEYERNKWGLILEGDPNHHIPDLSVLNSWKDQGLIFIEDISSGDKKSLLIARNSGVRAINNDQLFRAVDEASYFTQQTYIYTLYEGTGRPIGLKNWIKYTYTRYLELLELDKSNIINKINRDINIMKNFNIVRDEIINNIKNEVNISNDELSQKLGIDKYIIDYIDDMKISRLRSIDSSKELNKLNQKLEEISSWDCKKYIVDNFM